MADDKGVAASPPGHSDEPASSLAAIAGSVPNAGDLILFEGGMFREQYIVARVVKAGALGKMWVVERYSRAFMSRQEGWEPPVRRKISRWFPLANTDPAKFDARIRAMHDDLFAAIKAITAAYHANVTALAQGTEARSDKTACGLGPKGDGPVAESHAPNSSIAEQKDAT